MFYNDLQKFNNILTLKNKMEKKSFKKQFPSAS